MFWPDYSPRKKQRGSLLIPTILLGLLFGGLFGVLSGLVPVGRFADSGEQSPVLSSMSAETVSQSQDSEVAAAEPASVNDDGAAAVSTRERSVEAPDFVLPDLFDESVGYDLTEYRGRPVILNFWASWCVPCKEEMPALQRVYEQYRDKGLVILGVNQTFSDDLNTARDFVTDLGLTFPNLRDDTGNTSRGLYQVIGLPTSVFISAEGEIAYRQIGQMTDAQVDSFSRLLLIGGTIRPSR